MEHWIQKYRPTQACIRISTIQAIKFTICTSIHRDRLELKIETGCFAGALTGLCLYNRTCCGKCWVVEKLFYRV